MKLPGRSRGEEIDEQRVDVDRITDDSRSADESRSVEMVPAPAGAFRSSLMLILLLDMTALLCWRFWNHPGPHSVGRLAVMFAVSVPLLAAYALRPTVRRLYKLHRRGRWRSNVSLLVGSTVCVAMLTVSFAVNDSLHESLKSVAGSTLGPVDHLIFAQSAADRTAIQQALVAAGTADDQANRVIKLNAVLDGRLSFIAAPGFASANVPGRNLAVTAIEMDFIEAAQFGKDEMATGIAGLKTPLAGHCVVGEETAKALSLSPGQTLSFESPGGALTLVVDAILPRRGLASLAVNGEPHPRTVFVPPGTLTVAASQQSDLFSGQTEMQNGLRFVIALSNLGGVLEGERLSLQVRDRLQQIFTPSAPVAASPPQTNTQEPLVTESPVQYVAIKHEMLERTRERVRPLVLLVAALCGLAVILGLFLLLQLYGNLSFERALRLANWRTMGVRRLDAMAAYAAEACGFGFVTALLGAGIGSGLAALALRSGVGSGTGSELRGTVRLGSVFSGAAIGFVLALVSIILGAVAVTKGEVVAAFRRPARGTFSGPSKSSALIGALIAGLFFGYRGFADHNQVLMLVCPLILLVVLLRIGHKLGLVPDRVLVSVPFLAVVLGYTLLFPFAYSSGFSRISGSLVASQSVISILAASGIFVSLRHPLVTLVRRFGFSKSLSSESNPISTASPVRDKRAAWLQIVFRNPVTAPLRSLLSIATFASVSLSLVSFLLVSSSLSNYQDARVHSAAGGWGMLVRVTPEGAAQLDRISGLAEVEKSARVATATFLVTTGSTRPEVSAEVASVTADYLVERTAALEARATGLADDAAAFTALINTPGTAVVDRSLAVDESGKTTIKVGSTVFVRNRVTAKVERLTVTGVARSLAGLGTIVVGPVTMDRLVSGGPTDRRLLLSVKEHVTSKQIADLSGGSIETPIDVRTFGELASESGSILAGMASVLRWLLVAAFLFATMALVIMATHSATRSYADLATMRAVGLSTKDARLMALFEAIIHAVEGLILGVVLTLFITARSASLGAIATAVDVPILSIAVVLVLAMALVVGLTYRRHEEKIVESTGTTMSGSFWR